MEKERKFHKILFLLFLIAKQTLLYTNGNTIILNGKKHKKKFMSIMDKTFAPMWEQVCSPIPVPSAIHTPLTVTLVAFVKKQIVLAI